MPYLPPQNQDAVIFPGVPVNSDFWLQVNFIEEKYKRFYPLVTYYPLLRSTTPSLDPAHQVPVGGDIVDGSEGSIGSGSGSGSGGQKTGTVFDPLYGEAVDPIMLDLGEWVQPHQSGVARVYDVEVYDHPVQVNMRIAIQVEDAQLHQWGFEKMLDLMTVVPVSILDSVGVTVTEGDYFVWGGQQYEVVQVGPNNRYLNMSTYLYVSCMCQNRRRGS